MNGENDIALVASGCYRYSLNNQRQQLSEPWALYRQRQSWLLRSERQIPESGFSIATETLWQASQLMTADLHWQQSSPQSWQRSVRYQLEADGKYAPILCQDLPRIWPGIQPDDDAFITTVPATHADTTHALKNTATQSVMFPLMRVYMGHVIQQLLQRGGQGEVLVPWIKDPYDRDQLLKPDYSHRSVRWIKDEDILLSLDEQDSQMMSTQAFIYEGDQYGDDSTFWLHRGLLMQYEWHQAGIGQWLVTLSDFDCLSEQWPALFQSWNDPLK